YTMRSRLLDALLGWAPKTRPTSVAAHGVGTSAAAAKEHLMAPKRTKRLIVGISGASGVIYGIRLLEILREVSGVETQLVASNAARRTVQVETDYSVGQLDALPSRQYRLGDMAAPISSGSFKTAGMVVVPCSMKTVAGIALSYSDNLLLRAADVVLKERR